MKLELKSKGFLLHRG